MEKFIKERVNIDLSNCQYEILEEIRKELKWVSEDSKDFDIVWQDSALSPISLSKLNPYQRINHFPGIYAISRKDYLAKHLKAMEKAFPSEFNFYPNTWILPQEYNSLKTYLSSNNEVLICKPPNLSQGKGIFLTRTLSEIPDNCVVQKYLDNPYLIEGFKFDLRIYVLVTGFDPLRVYIHKDGLVRLATNSYCKPTDMNMQNVFMHLTNYAINKSSSNYVHNKKSSDDFTGHKRSFKKFMKNLKEEGENVEKLKNRIDDIILKTISTVQPFLSHMYRSSQPNDFYSAICFQILGFDVFLDHRLRPNLLEVNHTPSFATDTPLDRKIKKSVIKDCLKMLDIKPQCAELFRSEKTTFLTEKTCKNFGIVKNWRTEKKEKFLEEIILNETMHQGGYRKIFPCDNSEKYAQFIKYAENLYKSEKRRTDPVPSEKPMKSVRKSFVIRKPERNQTVDIRRKSCASRISFIPKIIQLKMN